jgi:CO/xanthine dehydrogenase Mo-binding subunit
MKAKAEHRLDYQAKVTGGARYLADMKVPGMCHGMILRSPLPHARIRRIDASRALEVPGIVAVLTREDIATDEGIEPYYGPVFKDQTIVAVEKVRHVGDPVAAVAAVELEAAREGLNRIDVEYEELPAVTDVVESVRPEAPLVHDTVRMPEHGFPDLAELQPVEGTNICTHFKLQRGNVETGFSESDRIFEDTFVLPTTQHCALEPHACIASVEPDGRILVWSTTQNPFVVRTQLSNIFKVPVSKVRVAVPYLGGGYGSKVYPKIEPLTVALARKAGRPVRIMLSREEVFYTVTKHAAVIRMKTGVKKDGALHARECEVLLDTGAYAEIGPRVAKKSGYTASGPYRIPHLKIDSKCVYTNKPPAGAFRGFGVSQSAWAHESQMDIVARALNMDALDLRLKNLYVEGDEFVTGEKLKSVGLKSCVEKVAEAVRWGEQETKQNGGPISRGKGIACLIKATITPSISCAVVKLNEDASATVFTGTVEMGQGSETLLAQIAAKELGIPLDQVSVLGVDTDVVPYDLTTSSSRSTFHMGKAVQLASLDLVDQLRRMAAGEFGVPLDEIKASEGKILFRETALDFRQVLFRHFGMQGGTLVGRGEIRTRPYDENGEKVTSAFWFLGAGAADVEVDRETGKIKILKYATAVDVGKAINPLGCRQQLAGGAITGLGQALFEQILFDNGQLVNPNLIDYTLPAPGDMPGVIASIPVEFPQKEGPYGAKGIGETSLIPVAPAIANAVFDAVGVRIKELPVTAEKIFLGLETIARKS